MYSTWKIASIHDKDKQRTIYTDCWPCNAMYTPEQTEGLWARARPGQPYTGTLKQILVQQMATGRICTLSVQLYSDVTSVNLVFVSDKIINNGDNFRIKCLSYSKITTIFLIFYFYTFLFNLGKHVNQCETISFSVLYLTLVTSCIIGLFLCCHILYLIIYLLIGMLRIHSGF